MFLRAVLKQPFWHQIISSVLELTGHEQFNTVVALLCYLKKCILASDRELVKILLTAARQHVTYCWKSSMASTTDKWIMRLWKIAIVSKMTYRVRRTDQEHLGSDKVTEWTLQLG